MRMEHKDTVVFGKLDRLEAMFDAGQISEEELNKEFDACGAELVEIYYGHLGVTNDVRMDIRLDYTTTPRTIKSGLQAVTKRGEKFIMALMIQKKQQYGDDYKVSQVEGTRTYKLKNPSID